MRYRASRKKASVHSPAWISLLLAAAIAGCGDDSSTTSGPGGAGGGGGSTTSTGGSGGAGGAGAAGGSGGEGGAGAAGGGGAGGGGACDGYQGQATAAEIGLSPFADEEAEQLAIEASGKVVAPQHVYERIRSDLLLIRAQYPEVQSIHAMKSWALNQMLMGFDAQALPAVQDGTYADWACPNDLYDMTSAAVMSSYVLLTFGHRLNIPMLAKEYGVLTGVQYAEPNGLFGDGNDVCVSIEGETKYRYVFDAGFGDCPAGCIGHTYWGFSTEGSPVQISPLGDFSNDEPQPAWFGALSECTKWL
jgi:hypothetical protein